MTDSLAGKLLVATPALLDETFYRTVVLVLAHDGSSSLGVVLNRPVESAHVGEHMPHWEEHVAHPARMFAGGPVEPAMALGLARGRPGVTGEGWIPMASGFGLVDLGHRPQDLGVNLERLRVFTGYAGWGSGQLESEIANDAWFVVDAEPGDAFTREPASLWRRVLRRQRTDIRIYELFPEDLRQN